MSMALAKRTSSPSRRRANRRTPQAGDPLEHEGRHGEHLAAHLGRAVELLGPGPVGAELRSAAPAAEAELEDEESEDA